MSTCLNLSHPDIKALVNDFGETVIRYLFDTYFPDEIPTYEQFIKKGAILQKLGIILPSKIKSELGKSFPKYVSGNQLISLKHQISTVNNRNYREGTNITYKLVNIKQLGQSDNYSYLLRKINKQLDIDSKIDRAESRVTDNNQSISQLEALRAAKREREGGTQGKLFSAPIDEIKPNPEEIQYTLKSISILQSPKAIEAFKQGLKNSWSLSKILEVSGITGRQADIILDLAKNQNNNTPNREQLITDLLAYQFPIRIETAKETKKGTSLISDISGRQVEEGSFILNGDKYTSKYFRNRYIVTKNDNPISEKEFVDARNIYENESTNIPTDTYGKKGMNLIASRGNKQEAEMYREEDGWQYLEQDIITPDISPNIQNHAGFANKEHSIGHFRAYYNNRTGVVEVQEIQSDLFQKNKGKDDLVGKHQDIIPDKEITGFTLNGIAYNKSDKGIYKSEDDFYHSSDKITEEEYNKAKENYLKLQKEEKENQKPNQFLQLLNKNDAWINFFVKAIIQDSAKKGFTTVRFPNANTAGVVQGMNTVESYKKEKEDKIKELERRLENKENELKTAKLLDSDKRILEREIGKIPTEITTLKKELKDLEEKGIGALKGSLLKYDKEIPETLKKEGYEVKQVTEFGNSWWEINLKGTESSNKILLNKGEEIDQGRELLGNVLSKKFFGDNKTIKLSTALEKIANSKNNLNTLALHLLKILKNDVNLNLVPVENFGDHPLEENKKDIAHYNSNKNEINFAEFAKLNTNDSWFTRLIIHEAIHAMAEDLMNDPDSKLREDLDKLYQYAKLKLNKDLYGLKNIDEFLAEIFSNPDFIDKLSELPAINIYNKYDNLFQEFWAILMRYLGINTKDSLYYQAMSLGTHILNQSSINKQAEIDHLNHFNEAMMELRYQDEIENAKISENLERKEELDDFYLRFGSDQFRFDPSIPLEVILKSYGITAKYPNLKFKKKMINKKQATIDFDGFVSSKTQTNQSDNSEIHNKLTTFAPDITDNSKQEPIIPEKSLKDIQETNEYCSI